MGFQTVVFTYEVVAFNISLALLMWCATVLAVAL